MGGTHQALQGSSDHLVCSQVKTEMLVCPECQYRYMTSDQFTFDQHALQYGQPMVVNDVSP